MKKIIIRNVFLLSLCILIFSPITAFALQINRGVTIATNVAMRKEPSTKSSIISRLGQGVSVEILKENVDAEWYQVKYNKKTGYINRMYISFDECLDEYKFEYIGKVINCKKNVNVRAEPKSKGTVLGAALKGARLKVTQKNYIKGWHQVEFEGRTGYIADKYLELSIKAPDDRLSGLTIKGGTLNPGFSPDEFGYVIPATSSKVTITASANSGVKVDVNNTGKNTATIGMTSGSMKTVRISLNGKVRYTLYITRNILVVGTWNIKRGYNSLPMQGRLLRNQLPDIMGIQEVFQNKKNGDIVDNLASLKTKTMSNTFFAPTIDYSNGGKYGIGIISRYKISGAQTFPLDSDGCEKRILQKCVISVGGKKVSVYNTHLSYESAATRAKQFNTIASIMKKDKNKYKILTGDFNAKEPEFDVLKKDYTMIVTGGTKYYNYGGDLINNNVIDNVIVTKNIKAVNSRIIKASFSDHFPVFTYLVLK